MPTLLLTGAATRARPYRPVQRRWQRGSTLLGFVSGLLLGLALALAVALYVTRSDTPLEDRGLQQPALSPALEAERNRDWNPNAALSTRPAPAAAPQPAPAPAAAPAAAPAPDAAAATALAPTPAPDALGQLIDQRSAAAAPTPEQPAQTFTYFVQAGAFASAEEAQAQRARLAMLGFMAQVNQRQQEGRTMYRVRLGPYTQMSEAESTAQRLQAQNIETALVRVAR